MRDLSSMTRDLTTFPALKVWRFNTEPSGMSRIPVPLIHSPISENY